MSLRIQAVVPPPDVYSIDGFGRAFGFGRSFIYEEIGAGRLRAVKAGRKTLIRRTDALAYIDSLPPITELGPHEPDPAQAPEDRIIPESDARPLPRKTEASSDEATPSGRPRTPMREAIMIVSRPRQPFLCANEKRANH